MRFLQNATIKQKLTRIIMLTSIVSLLLACSSFLLYEFYNFRSSLTRELSSLADIIGINSIAPLEFKDPAAGKETLDALRVQPRISRAAIYTRAGEIFAFYIRGDIEKSATLDIPPIPLQDGDYLEGGHLFVFKPIFLDDKRVGTVYIQSDLQEVGAKLKRYGVIVALILLASSLVAFILSAMLQKMISKPILGLAQTLNLVSLEKNYSIRATQHSRDEIGFLTERFNEMMVRIQDRDMELQKAQNVLEERVKDRTQELQREINVRKGTESKLIKAKEEAEESSKAKSDFLSRMSHELRTPLNAILGFGQLLESDLDEPLSADQVAKVREIMNAGNHLLELINEVLDLARIESGKLSLSVENCDLAELIHSTLTLIQPMARQRSVNLASQIPSHKPLMVKADRTRLRQVLLNLISNGIKYNRKQGMVTLNSNTTAEGRVLVHVTDTGNGIPIDKQEMIFEPFNRLDADQTGIEGTGIGLTICKRLMKMMGGSIRIDSSHGRGSCFTLELLMGESLPPQEVKIPEEPASESTGIQDKVQQVLLYIEDNPANLRLAQYILERIPDIKLLSAPEAGLGIELARAHKPDLILMDLNLPGMSGLEAFDRLKDYDETRRIPVIAISANAMQSDIDRTLKMGFKSYITKPIEVNQFLESVSLGLGVNVATQDPFNQSTEKL